MRVLVSFFFCSLVGAPTVAFAKRENLRPPEKPLPLRTRLQLRDMKAQRAWAHAERQPVREETGAGKRSVRVFETHRENLKAGRPRSVTFADGTELKIPKALEDPIITHVAVGMRDDDGRVVHAVDVITNDLTWRRLFSNGLSLVRSVGWHLEARAGYDTLGDHARLRLVQLSGHHPLPDDHNRHPYWVKGAFPSGR